MTAAGPADEVPGSFSLSPSGSSSPPGPPHRGRVDGATRTSCGSALRVDLALVEEVLRRGPWPAGLADAVEVLTGPVVDHRSAVAAEAAAWRRVEQSVEDAVAAHEALAGESFRAWWHG